jgi:hypothetical protein
MIPFWILDFGLANTRKLKASIPEFKTPEALI